MKKLIKVVVNVLSIMAGSHPAFAKDSFSISGLWKSDSKRSGGALEIGFPDIVDNGKYFLREIIEFGGGWCFIPENFFGRKQSIKNFGYNSLTMRVVELKMNLRPWIVGYQEENVSFLKPENIVRIFSLQKKVYAVTYDNKTENNEYELNLRLYQIEEMMDKTPFKKFIRISNTDIVNFD